LRSENESVSTPYSFFRLPCLLEDMSSSVPGPDAQFLKANYSIAALRIPFSFILQRSSPFPTNIYSAIHSIMLQAIVSTQAPAESSELSPFLLCSLLNFLKRPGSYHCLYDVSTGLLPPLLGKDHTDCSLLQDPIRLNGRSFFPPLYCSTSLHFGNVVVNRSTFFFQFVSCIPPFFARRGSLLCLTLLPFLSFLFL